MAAIEKVSGTAFVVAEFRAEENQAATPLYKDHVVELFLSDASRQAADRVAASFPPARDLVKIRTKYIDDTLDTLLGRQFRQVVILGAGLDTRAVRKPVDDVMYFEIDDPATLRLKQARYEAQEMAVNVTFIPGNYVTDGLIGLLMQNGFDPELPTYFIWEGNTMYLPLESIRQTLFTLKTHVKRFRLSFDYMSDAVVAKTTGDAGVTRLVESFAAMGAPWISGIRDVKSLAREHGLSLVENFKISELYQKYRRGRPAASPIFGFYSICTVGI
ncbi:MAG TPA: SAM-dependent methyltransferase [Vicinamibacterales bacterium]|jgi:methyltransferase (TIGR00027 family)